ncbi:MAG: homoserine dehydrogenase [Gemmatales bacterium]|nr:homoserine dehydrogenase [Gemmatales bacterium]
MEPLGIALLGCGTVGSGVARLLLTENERLSKRAGRPLRLRWVLVRDPSKPRGVALPSDIITTDFRTVLRDPQVMVVIELIGGLEPARHFILQSLEAGKDVITANKAVLAHYGDDIFETARRYGRTVAFEASVGGGIPIIAALAEELAANQILSIQAILNGTSNFILTQMQEEGVSYEAALAEAQRRGYAEADPTLDVSGADAAHKLAILSRLAFGPGPSVQEIFCRGIDQLQLADLRFAQELGYTIKLLAEAWLQDGQVALHVEPTLIHRLAPLAQVRGVYNAILVRGDVVGQTLYAGRGAGQMPTTSAILADLIDLAIGRAQLTFRTLRLWENHNRLPLRPPERIRSRFYLRITVEDRPGVIGEVATILGKHQVSISSVIQHEALDECEGEAVPVVIMTHTTNLSAFRLAVAQIDRLSCVAAPSIYYPVAD